uniref:Cytochrome b5 heme-binding domain-containing protein n=1 Tax=Kalanchoe fedtschenkoi TaxID=63787 RepID=A0A7N0TVS8_KALFE
MFIIVMSLFIAAALAISILIPRTRKSAIANAAHTGSKAHKVSNVYTAAEVSVHNKRTDCWIIIKDRIYDVTSYVEEHPGGDAILTHAGDDSTEGFFGYSFYLNGYCLERV